MVVEKHEIHQYKKVTLEKSVVYRCMLPGCSHYVRKAFIVNRISKCPFCGKDYLITAKIALLETLHCDDCTVRRVKKIKPEEVVNEFLVNLGESSDKDTTI